MPGRSLRSLGRAEALNRSLGLPRRGLQRLVRALGSLSWALLQTLGRALGPLRRAFPPLGRALRPLGRDLLQTLCRALRPLGGDLGCLGEVLEALDPSLGLPESGLGLLGPGRSVRGRVFGGDCWTHGGDVLRRTRITLVSSRLAAKPVPESGRWTPLPPEVALGYGRRTLPR
jgi:hypothetical protein